MEGASVRTKKVASQIRQELAVILRSEINDPRVRAIGMITVSHVDLSGDHRNATVFVSFMGEMAGKRESKGAIDVLNKAAGFVRTALAKRMNSRVVPQVHFKYDTSFDHAQKVQEAFARAQGAPGSEEEE